MSLSNLTDSQLEAAIAAKQGKSSLVPTVLRLESGNRDFNAQGGVLTSPTGAKGRMQVLDSTNRDPGFGVRPAQDDGLEERARVGRDYIAAMQSRYGNDERALAAYNAGPGTVDGALKAGGDNYLTLLPQEAQNYVKNSTVTKIVPTANKSFAPAVSALTDDDLDAQIAALQNSQGSTEIPQERSAKINAEAPMSPAAARFQGFNQLVPNGERLTAGAASLALAPFTDRTVSELYETARAKQTATSEAHPDHILTGNLVGAAVTLPIGFSKAIATTPGLGNAANALRNTAAASTNFIGRGSNLAARAVRSSAVAAPVGAAYGYGAGDEGSRFEAALTGAGVSGAIAGAVPLLGFGIGGALGYGVDKIARWAATKSGEIAGDVKSPEAIRKIYKRIAADYGPEEAQRVINSYSSKQGQSLVEAGGNRTASLAEGAAQYPSGGAIADEFFDEATGMAPEKLKSSITKNVSPSVNYYDTADKIYADGRKLADPLYKEAFAANQKVETPMINRILRTPEGRSALKESVANMQNEMALASTPDAELTMLAREAGMLATGKGVGKGLKLRTLDYVSEAMGTSISAAKQAGNRGEVRRLTKLKKGLLSEIDALDTTGLYAKARKASGDYLSAEEALEDGARFLGEDSQLIKRNYDAMGATAKKAYKAGALKAMRLKIDNPTDGTNIAQMFKRSATRQKLEAILSPTEYTKLMNDALATDKIYTLRNRIAGNSRTAQRQIAAKEFEKNGVGMVADMATGTPLRTGFNLIKGVAKKAVSGISDESAAEVSRILYATDPQEKYKIVKELSNMAKIKNPRGTEAGKKLEAFYALSDALKMSKNGAKLTKQDLQKAFEAKKGKTP